LFCNALIDIKVKMIVKDMRYVKPSFEYFLILFLSLLNLQKTF